MIADSYSRPGFLTPGIVRMGLARFAGLRSVGGGVTGFVPVPFGVTVPLASNDTPDVVTVVVGSSPGFADPVLDVSPTPGGSGTTALRSQQIGVAPPMTFALKPGQELWATGQVIGGARPAVTTVRF